MRTIGPVVTAAMSILCWNHATRIIGRTNAFTASRSNTVQRLQRCKWRPVSSHHVSKESRLFCSSILQVTQESIDWLQARSVPEPESSVHHLLAHALNLSWSNGFNQIRTGNGLHNRIVTADELTRLQAMLDRRATLEPLQYILGKWDFLDYTLHMQSPLLCPRPETEELVLHVKQEASKKMAHMKANEDGITTFRILDIGCGTGAIGISLADLLPLAQVTAIDVEPIAVQVSNLNAERVLGKSNGRYEARLCNVENFHLGEADGKKFDMIVSNPPYIPQAEMETLSEDVSNFESHTALCGGNDGLDVVRIIINKMPEWMESGSSCWMEVDPTHPGMLQQLLLDDPKVDFDATIRDMFGRERFVKLVVR